MSSLYFDVCGLQAAVMTIHCRSAVSQLLTQARLHINNTQSIKQLHTVQTETLDESPLQICTTVDTPRDREAASTHTYQAAADLA